MPPNDKVRQACERLLAAVEGSDTGCALVARGVECRLVVLSWLCREHVLLLGVPGTAKSMVCSRLGEALYGQEETAVVHVQASAETDADTDASAAATSAAEAGNVVVASTARQPVVFERLITKHTKVEELFGPLDIDALKASEMVHKTAGFLPSAHLAFLDEIFNGDSTILNALLTVLAERKFDNGSRGRTSLSQLRTVVGASNLVPSDPALGALYDRFLFRRWVDAAGLAAGAGPASQLGGGGGGGGSSAAAAAAGGASAGAAAAGGDLQRAREVFHQLLKFQPPVVKAVAEPDRDLLSAVWEESKTVVLPAHISEVLFQLRLRIHMEPQWDVSDRRWLKVAHALRVSAYTNGRENVDLTDLLLVRHMLWQFEYQEQDVCDMLCRLLNQQKYGAEFGIPDASLLEADEVISFRSGEMTNMWVPAEDLKAGSDFTDAASRPS